MPYASDRYFSQVVIAFNFAYCFFNLQRPPKPALHLQLMHTNLFARSTASLFGGGTVKHTEGTMASFPVGLMTFHLAR